MKILIALIILASLFTGCSYRVEVRDDRYRQARTVTMYMDHPVREFRYPVMHMDEGRYYREVVRGRPAPANLTFRFEAVPDMENFSERAYVMVDGKSFPMKLLEAESQTRTVMGNRPRYVRNGGRYERTVPAGKTITAVPVKKITARCSLDMIIERKILDAKTMSYRFYIGTEPVTLDVNPKQLEAIREFLQAGRS